MGTHVWAWSELLPLAEPDMQQPAPSTSSTITFANQVCKKYLQLQNITERNMSEWCSRAQAEATLLQSDL